MVIMVVFDKYDGRPFKTEDGKDFQDLAGKLVVPILRVREEFSKGNDNCSRTQFPLVVSYAITVRKSQGVMLFRAVCDISELSYVTISQVSRLDGLMMDGCAVPPRDPPTKVMQARLADYGSRLRNRFLEPLYQPRKEELGDMDCSI